MARRPSGAHVAAWCARAACLRARAAGAVGRGPGVYIRGRGGGSGTHMPPHEQEVPPSTAMFSRVKANVALPVGYHVDRITRLTNPELRAGYKAYLEYLAGQGCAGEAVLYHAVEWGAVEAVKRSGFSRSHRGINADVLGRGVYFTVNAAVAARFAHPGPNGERALFVARVALGRQMVGGNGGAAPGVRGDGQYCHSTVDNLGLPSLYATFYTSQCIPVFVIYFRVLVHVRAALPPAAATSAATGQLQTRPFGGRAAPAASAPQPRAAAADAATGQTQTRGHIDGSPRPATDEELRACGLSRQKVAYGRAIATSGVDFDALRTRPDAEVVTELVRIKGVGIWTAEIYAMFSLGHADVCGGGLERLIRGGDVWSAL